MAISAKRTSSPELFSLAGDSATKITHGLSSAKTQLVRYRLPTSNCTGRATEAISGS